MLNFDYLADFLFKRYEIQKIYDQRLSIVRIALSHRPALSLSGIVFAARKNGGPLSEGPLSEDPHSLFKKSKFALLIFFPYF